MGCETASYIVIGNEILSGKIQDLNTPVLAVTLRDLGVRLVRVIVVEDVVDEIARVVVDEAGRVDHLFTSGGVGPTHDDVTMRAVGQAFELPLVRHAQFEAEIALHYGEKANEPMLSMADVPQGAELLTGEGLFIPVVRVRNVYILPGVPELFQRKVAGIAERFRGRPFHLGKLFVDLDEGDIAAMLEVAQGSFPSVEIGSYPRYDDADYRVMVTFESKDLEAVRQVRAELLSRLPAEAVLRQE